MGGVRANVEFCAQAIPLQSTIRSLISTQQQTRVLFTRILRVSMTEHPRFQIRRKPNQSLRDIFCRSPPLSPTDEGRSRFNKDSSPVHPEQDQPFDHKNCDLLEQ
jgi:hypothetical protein